MGGSDAKGAAAALRRLAAQEQPPVPLPAAATQPTGEAVTIGLRPEALRLGGGAGSDPALTGEILSLEQLGNISYAHILCEGLPPVIAQLPATAEFARGGKVTATFSTGDVHLFDVASQAVDNYRTQGG